MVVGGCWWLLVVVSGCGGCGGCGGRGGCGGCVWLCLVVCGCVWLCVWLCVVVCGWVVGLLGCWVIHTVMIMVDQTDTLRRNR